MKTNYASYSLEEITGAVTGMGFKEVEWKEFPFKYIYDEDSSAVLFHLQEERYVLLFNKRETQYYLYENLGVTVMHLSDSDSTDDIEGSAIEVKFYELDRHEGLKSKPLLHLQFLSTSKGCRMNASVGGEGLCCGSTVDLRALLTQTIWFIDGFTAIIPRP